jgi:hypothetical protein
MFGELRFFASVAEAAVAQLKHSNQAAAAAMVMIANVTAGRAAIEYIVPNIGLSFRVST